MRASSVLLVLSLVVIGACGTPAHKIEQLRFSDQAPGGTGGGAAFDKNFELGFVRFIQAHLDVSYTPGWLSSKVPLTCTLSAPAGGTAQRIEREQELPRGKTTTTWTVLFSAAGVTEWREGRYSIRCETASSSAGGEFEVVDTSGAMARLGKQKSLAELLGPGQPGRPVELPGRSKPIDWETALSSWDKRERLGHTHAPDTAAAPPPPPTVTIAVMGSSSVDGTGASPAVRFDTARLAALVFEVTVTGGTTKYGASSCGVQRVATGVYLAGGEASVQVRDTQITIRNTVTLGATHTWLAGDYRVVCFGEGFEIAPVPFTVVGEAIGRNANNDFLGLSTKRLQAITNSELRLFESGAPLTPAGRRTEATVFTRPRYIGAQVTLTLDPATEPSPFLLTCHYFSTSGRIVGRATSNQEVPAGASSFIAAVGWGSAEGGSWRPGTYYAECDRNGGSLGGTFFQVR